MLKEIQKIREQYQEPFFRMALYHLLGKGTEHFDDETVAAAKAAVREQDAILTGQGKIPIMTPAFQEGLIDCAAELAKFNITDILRFVKHYLYFDGDEKLMRRCKECDKELLEEDGTLVNDGYEDEYYECDLCHEYSMEKGSVILCDSCGSYYTPNHINEDGENENGDTTCPYCSD